MKKNAILILGALLMLVVIFGCQKKGVTQPDSADAGKSATTTAGKDSSTASDKKLDIPTEQVASSDMGTTTIGKEGMFDDVLFDYDQYDVKDSYRPLLQSVAAYLMKNRNTRLSIEGHCDERGTNEYNIALGDRRAKAVSDYIVSLGASSRQIDIISYGEERPVCREADEACWQKNRRAHFVILQ